MIEVMLMSRLGWFAISQHSKVVMVERVKPQIVEAYTPALNRSLESIWMRHLLWGIKSSFLFVFLVAGGLLLPFPKNVIAEVGILTCYALFLFVFQWPFRLLYRMQDPLPEVVLSEDTLTVRRGKTVLIVTDIKDTYSVENENFWRSLFYKKRPFPLVMTFRKSRWWRGEPKSVAVGLTEETHSRWLEVFDRVGVERVS